MPVPLTTAAFVFAGILLGVGTEAGALIAATGGMLNQLIVTFVDAREDDDGLG